MKRSFAIMALFVLCATVVIWVLHGNVDDPNARKNGFDRKFTIHTIRSTVVAGFTNQVLGVAGLSGDQVFLYDKIPGHISKTTFDLEKIDSLSFRIPAIKRLAPVFTTVVQFPDIYIMGGNSKTLTTGNLVTGAVHTIPITPNFFTDAIVLSPEAFVVRTGGMMKTRGAFEIISRANDSLLRESKLLPASALYSFAYDGKMIYDSLHQRIFLLHQYCNLITCLDTSLAILFDAHTIDTVSYPRIYLKASARGLTHEKPPQLINVTGCLDAGKLYIHSTLKSDLETTTDFEQNDVIDVYETGNGQYIESFYLPKYKGESVRNFQVVRASMLLAFYPSRMVRYDISF